MKKLSPHRGLRTQTFSRQRDAEEQQPWRCTVCNTPVRIHQNDPCKCVTPDPEPDA